MTVDPTTLPGWRWLPGMLAIPAPGSDYLGWCRILMATEDGVHSWTDEDSNIFSDEEDGAFETFAALTPCLDDDATAGCLVALLGPEAWRVRYSPSKHKQAAGTPWVADLGTVTLHPSQGEAALAVAGALGRWA